MVTKHILIIGDSTGDATGEWVYRLASEKVAGDDATAAVIYHLYDERMYAYAPGTVVQEGTGGPVWHFWNASVSGRTPQSFTGVHFAGAILSIPDLHLIIWNHGHNVRVQHSVDAALVGRFIGPMDMVRLAWPGVPQILIRQNPRRDDSQMDDIMTALDEVETLYGDFVAVVDIYQHYIDNSKPSGWYADNIHPSIPTGVDEWMPLIEAAWDDFVALPSTFRARPALVALKATNLLTNGGLKQFASGLPVGWTKTGDGTVALDASERDGDDAFSIKIVNGTAATYIEQQISVTAYQGQTVTLAARQKVIDTTNLSTGPYFPGTAPQSGDKSRGRIHLSADGTGTPSSNQDSGNTYWGGTNGWRWTVTSLDVPADATTGTIRLYASNAAGADEGVCFGRAILVAGDEPRDAA